MKKTKMLMIVIGMICTLFICTSVAFADIKSDVVVSLQIDNPIMEINGKDTEIDIGRGTKPIVMNGRTLVPIRAIIEAFGGTVDWDGGTQTVLLTIEDDTIKLVVDSNTAYLNDNAETLDVAPTVINGRTMLPIRFVAERFNLNVSWDQNTQRVKIDNKHNTENFDTIENNAVNVKEEQNYNDQDNVISKEITHYDKLHVEIEDNLKSYSLNTECIIDEWHVYVPIADAGKIAPFVKIQEVVAGNSVELVINKSNEFCSIKPIKILNDLNSIQKYDAQIEEDENINITTILLYENKWYTTIESLFAQDDKVLVYLPNRRYVVSDNGDVVCYDHVKVEIDSFHFKNTPEYMKKEYVEYYRERPEYESNYVGNFTTYDVADYCEELLENYEFYESEYFSEYQEWILNGFVVDNALWDAEFNLKGKKQKFDWNMSAQFLSPNTIVVTRLGNFSLKEFYDVESSYLEDLFKGVFIKAYIEPLEEKYDKNSTEFQIACVKAINDFVCMVYTYDHEKANNNSVDTSSFIWNYKGVCGDYMQITKELLDFLSIPNIICYGEVDGIAHGWNVVYINGMGYHLDVTWNDTDLSSGVCYKYFLIGEEQIKRSRIIDYYSGSMDTDVADRISKNKNLDISFLKISR